MCVQQRKRLQAQNLQPLILGYSMLCRGDIQYFHHVHLYPQENKYFHEYAIPEYKSLLTECGNATFIDLTYESLFEAFF